MAVSTPRMSFDLANDLSVGCHSPCVPCSPRRGGPCPVKGDIFCVCGGRMNKGKLKQGAVTCHAPNCNKELAGSLTVYCPHGSTSAHRNGFFLCIGCAESVRNGTMHIPDNIEQPESGRKRRRGPPARITKQGYMNKRGSFLKKSSYKKSWFKLYDNKKMSYFAEKYAPNTEGHADLTHLLKVDKKGQYGLELTTKKRSYSFLLSSPSDRDDWYGAVQFVCFGIKCDSDQEPVSLIEDDIDHSFIAENWENVEDEIPPAAYSRPATPRTPCCTENVSDFPDMDYEEEGFFIRQQYHFPL